MSHALRFTAEKIAERIKLIRPMEHKRAVPLPPFRLKHLPDATAEPPLGEDPADWPEIAPYTYWGLPELNFLMKCDLTIPEDFANPALHLPLGKAGDIFTHPEALMYLGDQPFASTDRYHHTTIIPEGFEKGRRYTLSLHGWTGLTSWPPDPKDKRGLFMKPCEIVDLCLNTRGLVMLAETALDHAAHLADDRPEKHAILNGLDAAFKVLDTRDPIGTPFYATIDAALATLKDALAAAGPPMDVTLHGIGHAHLDIAYLWPVSQIRRKKARTTSNVLRLMDHFPEYRFSAAQPQLYAFLERDYPEIFAGMKARIDEGRWEVMGGMWVEADTNMPGPEALVRQIQLGRRYFAEKFEAAETPLLWLPDTFGFTWSLPQLMAQAGLRWFATSKVNWNQTNQMPSSTLRWQGIDGTQVLGQFLTTPREVQYLPFPSCYKSDLTAPEVLGTWEKSTAKAKVRDLPICYGYGDGGGGPTGQLIRKARAWGEMPGAPRLIPSDFRTLFERLEEVDDLPVWNDEIYMEGHRGVLTSQAWIKRANRQAEIALHEAEALSAMAGLTPDLTEAWQRLCLNQFHDILTGTAIREVFEDAEKDYAKIMAAARAARDSALAPLAPRCPPETRLTGASLLPHPMPRLAQAPAGTGPLAHQGTDLPTQSVAEGTLVALPSAAPYSLIALTPGAETAPETQVQAYEDGADVILENPLLRVEIAPDGTLASVFDKAQGREVLAKGAPGNQLQAFEDRPICWDAWDIDPFFEDRCEPLTGPAEIAITETGPLRAAVRVTRRYRASRITQTIRLSHTSRRIDFVTEADWQETHILLKVAFPVAILAPQATYDIQWGRIARPTHRNTSWDAARFEVPGQKWADLSEHGYGVALLNDCKYGYDIAENTLRLSLIKSATMPDHAADQGAHRFTYALLPHTGDWRGLVERESYDLNAPLILRPATGGQGRGIEPFVTTDAENVLIETLTPARDGPGVILRLFEAHRHRGPATLRFGRPMAQITRVDLLDMPQEPLAERTDHLTLPLRPFEIVSLHCVPASEDRG